MITTRRRAGSHLTLEVSRSRVVLRTGSEAYSFPSEKFRGDIVAWNHLVLLGLVLSGRTGLRFNYPDNYEYKWILDPILGRHPELKSNSPADYYALHILTEDVSYLGGQPGPATLGTIDRIARLVRRGWELWLESPKQFESPLLTARLLLMSGYFYCGWMCSGYYQRDGNIEYGFTLVSTIFMEELVRKHAGSGTPVPGVIVRLGGRDGKRLHIVFLENVVSGMLDGTLGRVLDRTLRRPPVNIRVLDARAGREETRLIVSSTWTGGEPVIVEYSTAEFTGVMNRLAEMLVENRTGEIENLLFRKGRTPNMLFVGGVRVILSGDHATLVTEDGDFAGRYWNLHSLRNTLFQKTGNQDFVVRRLCESMDMIRKHAPSLSGSSNCPVLDETILSMESPRLYIGRIGKRYYCVCEENELDVKSGDTVFDVVPDRYDVILETLSAIGRDDARRTLEEANRILGAVLEEETYNANFLVETRPCVVLEQYTSSYGRRVIVTLCSNRGELEQLLQARNPLYDYGVVEVLHYRYERLLSLLLEQYGWKDTGTITGQKGEKYRAYEKNNVYIVFATEKQ